MAASSAVLRGAGKRIPIGLEMYSVRGIFSKDPEASLRDIAPMGYQTVELYGPYYSWPEERVKSIRKLLDDLNLACVSTHNDAVAFTPDGMQKAIDWNSILGAHIIVMASAGGGVRDADGWKRVAETLAHASARFSAANLRAGFHNHGREFRRIASGERPIEIIAVNTPKNVVLQLDVGHCVEGGGDPVEWIKANPGRIRSLHLKEWSPEKKFEALTGEGIVPWKKVFKAAESAGGAEFYLIEWEGTASPALESVEKCLAEYKKIHG